MSKRVYNFYAGPATLPLPILERAREEFLDFAGTAGDDINHNLYIGQFLENGLVVLPAELKTRRSVVVAVYEEDLVNTRFKCMPGMPDGFIR